MTERSKPRAMRLALLLGLLWGCDAGSSAAESTNDADLDAVLDRSGDAARPVDAEEDAPPDAAPDASRSPGLEDFYELEVVQTIELSIDEADRAAMLAALPERIYVPATFRWRDVVVENVGVRFKGNSSSQPQARHKRSFLVKFAEFEDGQRFLGLRRVALDNAVQFGSLFSEPIVTSILRAEGVTASRANHARLLINGAPAGVYVNVERIDEAYLEDRFGNSEGPLYKVDEGGPGADLSRLPNPESYAHAFEAKTDAADAGHEGLAAFVELIHDTPDLSLPAVLEARFALEPFLRLMAVMVYAGAFDQYTGWNPHNYYLYDDPESGRWHYLVWDLDVGFADEAFGRVPVLAGWNASYPLPRIPRPLLERILRNPALLARYRAEAERILETWFRPEVITPRLTAMHERLRPHLADDPFPPVRITNPGDTDYESIVASQQAFMRARYAQARAQLDDPMVVEPSPPEPGPMPTPGEPSADAPTDLRVLSADAEGVRLAWTDNATGEVAHIVQRCTGEGCEGFANRIGLQGSAVTEAHDPSARSGSVYRYRVYGLHATPQGPAGTGVSNVVEARP